MTAADAPAYGLLRRSRQHQDLSIESQREAIERWAEGHAYTVVRWFADDASGLDTERRREFLALLQLCSDPLRRRADIVLCYDVSRFSRLDPEEASFHEYSLRRAGVRVIYTHEAGANEGGMAGHLIKSLKRVMAHDYSQKLSQVVQRGLRAHAARGDWTGGRPPYGYRRAVRRGDGVEVLAVGRWKARGETVVLVVDPAEAAVVGDIFDAYVRRRLGLTAIAAELNTRGMPAPTSRLTRRAWSKGTVWAMLRNPIYVGQLVYGKAQYSEIGRKRGKRARPAHEHVVVPDGAPAIVARELWDAAQHAPRAFAAGRPWHRSYLLTGFVRCGRCGRHCQVKRSGRASWGGAYVCGGYRSGGVGVCDGFGVPVRFLEDAVLTGIAARVGRYDRDDLARELRGLMAEADAGEDRLAASRSRLAETTTRIERLVLALADGGELRGVREALVGLEAERARLEREIASASRATREPDQVVEALFEALARLPEVLASGSHEDRAAAVRMFLKEIRVNKDTRRVTLDWYRLPHLDEVNKLVELRGNGHHGLLLIPVFDLTDPDERDAPDRRRRWA